MRFGDDFDLEALTVADLVAQGQEQRGNLTF